MEYTEIMDYGFGFIGVYIIFQYIMIIVILSFIIKTITQAIRRSMNHIFFKSNVIINNKRQNNINELDINKYKRTYNDVTKDKLAMFNTDDIDSLKDFFYNKFEEFEIAYNNLDYDVMRILSTKQLFQNYYTGITLDLKIGKKRIINAIEKKKVILFEIDSTIAKQTACAMIEISYLNYMTDKHGHVISGSRDKKITERFEVTFRKDFEKDEYVKCSNCGATVSGKRCDYCRTAIRNEEFKISSIKRIID